MTRLSWRDRAACAGDPDFTERACPAQVSICRGCSVTAECLAFALAWEKAENRPTGNGKDGGWPVYGGLTAQQRLELIRSGR